MNIQEKIEKYIKESRLNRDEKDFLVQHLGCLGECQLDFLEEAIQENANIIFDLVADIKRKKEILLFGSDKEWEECIV